MYTEISVHQHISTSARRHVWMPGCPTPCPPGSTPGRRCLCLCARKNSRLCKDASRKSKVAESRRVGVAESRCQSRRVGESESLSESESESLRVGESGSPSRWRISAHIFSSILITKMVLTQEYSGDRINPAILHIILPKGLQNAISSFYDVRHRLR